MFDRANTKQVIVDNVKIGNNKHIIIQSMTNIKTEYTDKVLNQIKNLYISGCELVRVSILDQNDIISLKKLIKLSPIPIIADIHFDYNLAIDAINAGIKKIRLNPGNISNHDELKKICDLANENNVVIRIGINSGSIPDHILNKYNDTAICMVELAKEYIELLNSFNFFNIVVSLKSSDPFICQKAYELFANQFNYPLHLGVTEAGDLVDSAIKSTFGLSNLLLKGIGNTIRISISDDPIKEVYVAKKLLNVLGLRKDMVNIISCPSCGRLEYDLFTTIKEIKEYTKFITKPLTISILGCVVNGIQEGKHADIGIAGSKNKCILFKNNKIYSTIESKNAIEELKKLIDNEISK